MDWFQVDREGLAKVLERRGKEYVVYELVSNFHRACCLVGARLVKVFHKKLY